MPPFRLVVTEIATFAGQLRVRCAGGEPAAPGQGYLLQPDPAAPLFLRPLVFPWSSPPAGCEFWAEAAPPWLDLEPGARLEGMGPIGRGLAWPARATRLLLVASRLSRLWPLMTAALARGWPVTWLWPGAWPADLLNELPPAVEVARGVVTPELVEWAELVLVDVPDPAELARTIRAARPLTPAGFVRMVTAPPLPCGFGGCQACWMETAHGRRLACLAGPILAI